MRKYEVITYLGRDFVHQYAIKDIIEADRIEVSVGGSVLFQVEDNTKATDYTDGYRTIAVRQNANVTELRE